MNCSLCAFRVIFTFIAVCTTMEEQKMEAIVVRFRAGSAPGQIAEFNTKEENYHIESIINLLAK